jgi:hypothetical protein
MLTPTMMGCATMPDHARAEAASEILLMPTTMGFATTSRQMEGGVVIFRRQVVNGEPENGAMAGRVADRYVNLPVCSLNHGYQSRCNLCIPNVILGWSKMQSAFGVMYNYQISISYELRNLNRTNKKVVESVVRQ